MVKRLAFSVLIAILLVALALPIVPASPALAATLYFVSSYSDGSRGTYSLYEGMTYNDEWVATSRPDPTSSNYILVGQRYADVGYVTYSIYRGFVYFDTSDIPDDAVITSAKIRIRAADVLDDFEFYLRVYEGMATYPHDPLVDADYNKANYSTDVLGGVHSGSISTSGYTDINLNSDGEDEINKTGTTKFILRSYFDTSGIPPLSFLPNEYVVLYSREKGANYAPKLEVTYTVPITAPDVTTEDIQASSLDETSVRVWGYLADDGGEPCSVRFEYGLTAGYGSYTSWQSGMETDTAFSTMLTGLSRGTTYHFRAVASNSNDSDEGLDKDFLTKPASPSDPYAIPGDAEIDLVWYEGDGADKTRIYFKTGTYPSAIITTGVTDDSISCDGAEIYWDGDETKNHAPIDNGTTYYYLLISTQTDGGHTRYSIDAVFTFATPAAQTDPAVSTEAATGIGDTYATMNLYLTSLGGYADTDVSFQYYKEGEAVWGESTTPVEKTEPCTYAKQVTGLDAASQYYFRAKAENDHGITYGSSRGFTTGGVAAPTIETNPATDITSTTATLHGTVTDYGGLDVDSVSFEWGLTTDYGHSQGAGAVEGDTFWLNVENLVSDVTYHYRAIGSNSSGTGYGDDVTFATSSAPLPTVQTKAASSVGAESAILNGLLVGDGGLPCEVQFQWYVEGGTVWDNETGWQPNKFSNDSFNYTLGGLEIGLTYYFRAQARNDGTIVNGASMSFTTAFGAPASFEAVATSSSTINLSWARAGEQTYVYMNTTGYPADRTDGELVYSGTGEVYVHSNLVPGITYYYRAWSWSSDNFSATYSDALATTLAAGAGEQERPETVIPPDQPSTWFSAPDSTRMSNFILYPYVNATADAFEIPRGSFWMFLVLIAALIAGIFAYFATRKAMLAVIVVAAVLGMGTWMGLLPLWIIMVYVVIGGALVFHEARGG